MRQRNTKSYHVIGLAFPMRGFAVNAQIDREVRAHFHTASTVSNEHGGFDMSFNRTLLLRTRTLGAAFAVALLATAPAGSQEAAAPPLTRTNLTAAIASDADARDIFSLVFAHVFQPGSPRHEFLLGSPRQEFLLAGPCGRNGCRRSIVSTSCC
jgi:hypothetical protein